MEQAIKGFDTLMDRLATLSQKAGIAAVRKGVSATAKEVRESAITRAPIGSEEHRLPVFASRRALGTAKDQNQPVVAPGYLKSSIGLAVKFNRRTGSIRAIIAPYSEAFYGEFVESGLDRQAKQPYLVPALESNVSRLESVLTREINKAIDETIRRREKKYAKSVKSAIGI